jgi:predicted nucleic acid-binding protein
VTAVVLLDACVLVPQRLSSLLLTLAEEGLFAPRCSEPILSETERALTEKLGVSKDQANRRIAAMNGAFPEASVHGFEAMQEDLTCDPKDRHVLAAAIAAGAETLVTINLKDFPDESCAPHDVTVMDPDVFLLELLVQDERACAAAVEREAARMRRPAMTAHDVLAGIAVVAPTFANTMHQTALGGAEVSSDVPAYIAAPVEESPLQDFANDPDMTNPLHVAFAWWTCLMHRDEYLDVLHNLTWAPLAFNDYAWADELLEGRSIASRVYYAVDDPTGDVAFVRFVPEVAQSSQVFESFHLRGARFMTLRRRPEGSWCVWGLGTRMVGAREVLNG